MSLFVFGRKTPSVKLYVFMEECVSNKTLYDMVKSTIPLKCSDIRTYTKVITSGIDKLQSIGVAHRHLKLQHILFDFKGNPKLCGWSKCVFYFDREKHRILLQKKERRVRRNDFLPPESFESSYDPSKADIWSIGVLLVAMCTKRYPFNVRDTNTKFSSQWRQFVKKHQMNTFVRNVCNKIFIINPKRRISTEKILKHDYFSVSIDMIVPLSIKADSKTVDQEPSRVGGVSATDIHDINNSVKMPTEDDQDYEDDDQDDYSTDFGKKQPTDDNADTEASDSKDGGGVGDEEEYAGTEESETDKYAPEEAETEADPDYGGEYETDETAT